MKKITDKYNIDAYKLYRVFQNHGMTSASPLDYEKLVADILEAIEPETLKGPVCSICNKSTSIIGNEYSVNDHLDCVLKKINYEVECDEQKQSRI